MEMGPREPGPSFSAMRQRSAGQLSTVFIARRLTDDRRTIPARDLDSLGGA
jgi:hypothetical protein